MPALQLRWFSPENLSMVCMNIYCMYELVKEAIRCVKLLAKTLPLTHWHMSIHIHLCKEELVPGCFWNLGGFFSLRTGLVPCVNDFWVGDDSLFDHFWLVLLVYVEKSHWGQVECNVQTLGGKDCWSGYSLGWKQDLVCIGWRMSWYLWCWGVDVEWRFYGSSLLHRNQ